MSRGSLSGDICGREWQVSGGCYLLRLCVMGGRAGMALALLGRAGLTISQMSLLQRGHCRPCSSLYHSFAQW